MSELTITLLVNRWKPTEYLNIEAGHVTAGPIQPGWLSARWQLEPVPGTSYVRLQNLWKPDQYLHIEAGVPEAGPIAPGWLSAQWQFEEVPGTPFVRMRNRWPLIRYAHIEGGQIDIGHVEPGWLSAHWFLERVQGTSFVRLRNRWKPDQGLHIESGVLSAGPVEPGQLSGQWSVEPVTGTPYVRFKNRWKPDHYFHIEGGRAEAGPIHPGWLSAQWLREPVAGTTFVSLRNRWELDRYLHIERGVPEVGIVEPGWLSAQWLRTRQWGTLRSKVIPLELVQRKFDEFVNDRERPLFKLRIHGEHFGSSKLTAFFDDPVTGYDHEPDKTHDLGHLEIDLPGPFNPDFHFNDLNSDRITLNVRQDGIEARIDFETQGEELKVNNFENVDFTGFSLTVKGRLALDSANALVDLATDKSSVSADVSVDIGIWFDGDAARRVERKINTEVFEAMQEYRPVINQFLTRMLVGGDFDVVGVSSDAQVVSIDYILPPGQLEPFPEVPQPPLDPGRLANIDHIVVLMMENRSFDHMLGYLKKHGGRQDVDGLRGGEKNRYKGRDYLSFPLPDTVFHESPCHGHECVEQQINGGKLDGFVADFAKHYESQGVDPGRIMGYHQASRVPVYDALAREFLVCQRWFAAHPGPTFPNRFYTLTGRLNRDSFGNWQFDNPHGDDFKPVSTKTLFDHLTDRGVSWRYYEHGYCFLRMFERYTFDNKNIVDAGADSMNFVASALAGTLPAVTFIDPDFIDVPPGFDDGAPADIAAGQHFIGTVVNAVMNGPLWGKTLLVITYDEHGGFFDHLPPPAAVAVSAIDHYGVRVPAFVISPWVDRGRVSDVVFDHTSIAKTIARRFMSAHPPDMGERMAAAHDLSRVLRPTSRQDKPSIPLPPAPVPNPALARQAELMTEGDRDFKGVLRAVRSRYSMRS